MIGVRDRVAFIDLSEREPAGRDRDARREIVRALMFAQGIDERGRRLPLAFDRVPDELRRVRAPLGDRHRDAKLAAIYQRADIDDGAPNVRILGRTRNADVPSPRPAPMPSPEPQQMPSPEPARSPLPRGPRRRPASSPATVMGAGRPMTQGATALAAEPLAEQAPPRRAERASTRSRAELRVVPRPASTAGRRLTAAFWTLFIVGLLFLAVVMHATLAERQAQLDDTHVQVERAERDHELLRIDVARLESPEVITAKASLMGLVTPERIRFVSPAGTADDGTAADGSSDTTAASGATR